MLKGINPPPPQPPSSPGYSHSTQIPRPGFPASFNAPSRRSHNASCSWCPCQSPGANAVLNRPFPFSGPHFICLVCALVVQQSSNPMLMSTHTSVGEAVLAHMQQDREEEELTPPTPFSPSEPDWLIPADCFHRCSAPRTGWWATRCWCEQSRTMRRTTAMARSGAGAGPWRGWWACSTPSRPWTSPG